MIIKNNYFIDNLKVILIFLVVFGHLIERYIDTNNALMGIYVLIYTFHMPLFVFISGFLSKNVYKSRKIFIQNLLLPYIVFNIIWYVLSYIYVGQTNIPIIYPGWTLWFLLSLFFWRFFLRYLIRIKYVVPLSFFLGIMVGMVPNGAILSFSRSIVFLPFFLLGYYTDDEKAKKLFGKLNRSSAIIAMIIFLIITFFITENQMLDYKFLYGSYSYLELDMNIWQGMLYRVILYMCSIMLGLCVCKFIPTKETFFSNVGKSTMYIYIFHVYIIILIFYFLPVWGKSDFTNWIILLSPILIIYILSRNFIKKVYNYIFDKLYKIIA